MKIDIPGKLKLDMPITNEDKAIKVLDTVLNYMSGKIKNTNISTAKSEDTFEENIFNLNRPNIKGIPTNEIISKTDKKVKENPSVSKVVELEREEKAYVHKESDGFTIGDKINLKEALSQEPEFWKTGIKEKNGVNHYRCRYLCPSCGTLSNHYITPEVTQVNCHQCDQQMDVIPMEQVNGKEKDSNSNYYIAGHYQVRE